MNASRAWCFGLQTNFVVEMQERLSCASSHGTMLSSGSLGVTTFAGVSKTAEKSKLILIN